MYQAVAAKANPVNTEARKSVFQNNDEESRAYTDHSLTAPLNFNFSNLNILSRTPSTIPSHYIQPKLKINSPGDRYEQEADYMANQVIKMPAPVLQRKCSRCGKMEEEHIQRKPLVEKISSMSSNSTFQRKCAKCEKEEKDKGIIQTKSYGDNGGTASSELMNQIQQSKGGGEAMDTHTKSFMESRFGADFSNIRIHTNGRAKNMNQQINARAFTLGSNIYFNEGQYQPNSNSGKHLLAHELTHVIQQNGGNSVIQMQIRTQDPNVYETEYEGDQYRVRRIREPRNHSRTIPQPNELDVDADENNVTIRISWCRGTRGEVRIGANLTGQALSLAQQIAGIITSGSGRDDVLAVLQGADVTPFIETVIAKSGEWRIFVRGDITVGADGVTAGGGRVGIRRGPVDIGIAGRGDENGGSITGQIEITPGRTDETFECEREVVRQTYTTRYICERHVPAHEETRTRDVEREDIQSRYIYFQYARDVIDEDRSLQTLNEIENLLTSGYTVTSITGFTSPEGTEAPGRIFIGNTDLGRRRADAVLSRLQSICVARASSLLSFRNCTENALTNVSPLGEGELYGRATTEESTRELSGRALQENAVREFRSDEREAPHRNQEFLESLEGLSLAQQTDRIYPLLRRAVVILSKRVTEQENYQVDVPAGYRRRRCPRAVLDEARVNFNLRDSL